MAEEANRPVEAELAREVLEAVLEDAAAGDVETSVRPRIEHRAERPEQDDVALDRDQPADAQEPGLGSCVRLRLGPGRDAVVDDLEVGLDEPLGLGQVAGKASRDRDLPVRERADRPVAEREDSPLAELVEAVLGGKANRDAREGACRLSVGVGVHEVRVEDRRPLVGEVGEHANEGDRVDVGSHLDPVDRHPACLECARELPRPRLLLVQHQEAHVPAARLQRGQQLKQVRLGARDAGDLLDMEDDHGTKGYVPPADIWRAGCRPAGASSGPQSSDEVEVAELEMGARRRAQVGVE